MPKKPSPAAKSAVALLVATRKGAFIVRSDAARRSWKLSAPLFLGHMIHHVVQDPRDPRVLLAAARTGHLGPTVYRSKDFGRTWKEAVRPPAFKKAADGKGRVVDHVFWLTPGHPSEPGVWLAGTSPHGLFRTADGGATWDGLDTFNESPRYSEWCGGDATPDGPKMHSVTIDPRDPAHLYIGMSSGGIMESPDGGRTWTSLNKGLDVVAGFDASDQLVHDPHCLRQHPANPDRLYQQNHCGIYRLDRPGDTWVRIGRNMPKQIGDVGFPMTLHPRNPDACWVFPMDGTDVWPRTSPGGKPAVYGTRDAGKTWKRLDKGLPKKDAWLTVKRQAMCADAHDPVGLYFGATQGSVWGSRDEGRSWAKLAEHLPHIYAVEAAAVPR
ncbi:MAG: glycosyl hydrolase [Elusimicrobia bacterium]|nr:glycosyl hydrolase [Elusimicrobiota bacterium]